METVSYYRRIKKRADIIGEKMNSPILHALIKILFGESLIRLVALKSFEDWDDIRLVNLSVPENKMWLF